MTVRGLACFGGVSQRVLTALVEYWTRRPVRFWVESELRYPELFQGGVPQKCPGGGRAASGAAGRECLGTGPENIPAGPGTVCYGNLRGFPAERLSVLPALL